MATELVIESATPEQVDFPAHEPFPGLGLTMPARTATIWSVVVRGFGRNPEQTRALRIEAPANATLDDLLEILTHASQEDRAGYQVGD